jgi:3-hydroxyisobutyrate dehydrogenase-like beta-hydroxyacid dehydrogenase
MTRMRDFKPGFRIDRHHKDMGIAIATARNRSPNRPALLKALQTLNGEAPNDPS